jgi:type IV secretion system protein VirD4
MMRDISFFTIIKLAIFFTPIMILAIISWKTMNWLLHNWYNWIISVIFLVAMFGIRVVIVFLCYDDNNTHFGNKLTAKFIIFFRDKLVVLTNGSARWATIRAFFRAFFRTQNDTQEQNTHGSARWATNNETAKLTQNDGLIIGRDLKTGKLIRYDGPAHLLTMAPARSGKGVSAIIPNLLTVNRSMLVVDPKGENARVTGRAREDFGTVHILDPFGETGKPSAAYNPLDALDAKGPDIAEDAATLADALVLDDSPNDPHWNDSAKALISGIIHFIVSKEEPEHRTLARLREHLTSQSTEFKDLLKRMRECGGLIARAANQHLSKPEKEAASILSSAQRHTQFLDSPRINAVLNRSDFKFADLKTGIVTVFLVLPPDRLDTYARWLRLMIGQGLQEMSRTRGRPEKPVLFLLDEFAALGKLAAVERAMGLMAGYGVQLWPILQDIHQLQHTYGQRAGTFQSNAGVLQVFGTNDHESAKMISDRIGKTTIVFDKKSKGESITRSSKFAIFAKHFDFLKPKNITTGQSTEHTERPLLTPDEIRVMSKDMLILFVSGMRPIMARKPCYYKDSEFAGRFEENSR